MAIGLIIGIEFDPSPADFEELLTKGAIKQQDFQYVTLELSIEEAGDRKQLKNYFKSACVKQNWLEGLKYADDLKFSDVMVFGKPVVIVEPKGFDEPEAKPGGIIAGIGFTPAQADLNLLAKQIKLQPGHEYVLKSYSKSDASSETFLATAYLTVAKQQGWAPLSGSLSIQRRKINGKDFLMVQPSPPDETIEEGKKAAQTGPVTQSEKLIELFNREKIDPSGKKILAFAILFERQVAPAVWVGPGPDPFAVEGENAETSQARFLASKIVPGYQPHFIPAHLTIDTDTFVAGRPLRKGESLEVAHINQVLAVMLADLLADQDLSKCSALSLSGESVALGQNRFAIVVGGAPVTREEGEQEDTHPAQDTAMKVKSSEDMQVTRGLDTEGEKDIKEYDVFISYSSQDKIIADAICATLENRKIRCWIAPRNVPMDKPFGTAVVNAIRGSRSFVLVLSEGSSNSASVLREVSEAFDNGIPIVPFRIQDVEPSEKLSFYIKSLYCLDAIRPPIERNLAKLADAIQALLPVSADAESPEPQNK